MSDASHLTGRPRTLPDTPEVVARRLAQNERYHQTRLGAFRLLGGHCVICGETDTDVLQVDHVYLRGDVKMCAVRHVLHVARNWGRKAALAMFRLLCANDHARETLATLRAGERDQ